MAKVPDNELLSLRIATLEGEITMEFGRINKVLEANPNATNQVMFNEFTTVYNLLTRRHSLELQRTYPGVQVMYEIEFLGVRDADGDFLERPSTKGRIADSGLKGDFLQLIEVKTIGEILRSVPKTSQVMVDAFLKSSTLGKQIAVERYLIKWAKRKGVALLFRAHDPVTLRASEFEMPVENVKISRVQSYKNMGDGLEVSDLFKPPPTKASPSRMPSSGTGGAKANSVSGQKPGQAAKQISSAATEVRALENRGTENRGTGSPKQEKRASEVRPVAEGKIRAYEGLFKPNPADALESNAGLKGGLEGGAIELYAMQLSNMNQLAKTKAENAVEERRWEIDDLRSKGEYVLVQVRYAEPKSRDLTGMSTDSYPIFWGIEILHGEPFRDPSGNEASMEQLLRFIKQSNDGVRAKSFRDDETGRKTPPGREINLYDYKLYPPFPRATGVGRVSDEPDLNSTLNWQLNMFRKKPQPSVETIRGTVGRCTMP